MALEKTWQYQEDDAGTVLTNDGTVKDCASKILWYFQASLFNLIAWKDQAGTSIAIGAGVGKHVCIGSSDGVTAALDGVNRWGGGTYDGTKLVRAAAGVAHSWMVGQSDQIYWCWDYNGANDYSGSLWFSSTAFTGGSTTNRPTATKEFEVFDTGTTPQFSWNTIGGAIGQVGPCHGHMRVATDGAFFLLISHDAFGTFNFACHGDELADTESGDTYPYAGMLKFRISGGGTSRPFASGVIHQSHFMRSHTGGTCPNYYENLSVIPMVNGQYALTTVDGTSALFRRFPIFVCTLDAGVRCWRGRYADWKWAVQTHNDGVLDSGSTPTMMVCGETWVPARAAPLL